MTLSRTEERVLGNIVAKAARSKAEAEIVSLLQNKLAKFLDEADETLRRDFFTQVELMVSAASARKIAQHDLRPEEVTQLVEARRAEIAQSRNGGIDDAPKS